ncbi:hypothetical protein BJ944DRAFT_285988 [Cunninghamella echinulata]|nr:hypothetical protein BJ944DRAFT_285988 [Cunninghamella echinulata]
MKLSVIIITALISVTSAQQPIISITSPIRGTVYKAGTYVPIAWYNPTVDTINGLLLSQGHGTNLQPILQIADTIPAKNLIYSWKIPIDIPPANDYVFVFGLGFDKVYAGPFTITAPDASTPSNNSTTTPISPTSNGNKSTFSSINSSRSSENNNESLSGGIIAAIVIPIVIAFIYFYKRRNKNNLPKDTFIIDKLDPRLNIKESDFSSMEGVKFSKPAVDYEDEGFNKIHDDYPTDTFCKPFGNANDKNNQKINHNKVSHI